MSWTVYRHITPSGKSYIGITSKKPEERWRNGEGYNNKRQQLFDKAIEKYGWDYIQHNIVSTDLTEKEAKWLENYLICYYRTFVGFKEDCKGYNCTLGGEGTVGLEPWNKGQTGVQVAWNKGKHQTEETKQKISTSLKGNTPWNKGKKTGKPAWNKGLPSPRKGIPRDDKTKRKISESHIGIHPTEETKKKISTSLKGNTPWNKGIPHSEESKMKMRESHKGQKGHPSPHKGKHLVMIDGKRHYE